VREQHPTDPVLRAFEARADRVHPHSRDPLQPSDFACPSSARPVPTFARHALTATGCTASRSR